MKKKFWLEQIRKNNKQGWDWNGIRSAREGGIRGVAKKIKKLISKGRSIRTLTV